MILNSEIDVKRMLKDIYKGATYFNLIQRRRRSKWDNRLVNIRRVTKVTKGGKQINFRAVVIIGNSRGRIGVGVGKGSDVPTAIRNSTKNGRKKVLNITLTTIGSIKHRVHGRSSAAKVLLRPSAKGSGVIAGGSTRAVLELVGIKNILSKQLGSNNDLNNARATIKGLSSIKK